MDLITRVTANSLYQLVSRVMSSLAVLCATLLITRNLSREVWGDFIVVTSYLGLFTVIADFGINAVFVKEASKNKESTNSLFNNLLALRLVLALVSVFLALSVLALLEHSVSTKIGIIVGSALILLQSIFTSTSAAFQQRLRYDFYAVSDVLGSLSIILLVFIATQFNVSLLTIIAIFVLGNLVKIILALSFVTKIVGRIRFGFDFKLWKLFFLASVPIGLTLIFSQFTANLDKQVIALTSSEKLGISATVAAGIYGLSYRIFDFVIAISTFFANSIYPIMLKQLELNQEEFSKLVKKTILGMFVLGLFIGIVGWFLAPWILGLFENYLQSLTSLRILLISTPFFFVTALLLWINITLGKQKFLPFIYGFALLCNLALNLAFIPKLGYNFASWSTVITEVVILILLSLLLIYNKSENDRQI